MNKTVTGANGVSLGLEVEALYNWTNLGCGAPSWCIRPGFDFDEAHGEFVYFGGSVYVGQQGETWTYDPTTDIWTNKNPVLAPKNHNVFMDEWHWNYDWMSYDEIHEKMLLIGGSTGNETWTYNLSSNEWKNETPSQSPPGRAGYGAAYDCENGEVILFGGYNDTMDFNDTWTFNLTEYTWIKKTPLFSPSPRSNFSMAYDSANGLIVLFGGKLSSGLDNETWIYNLSSNTWTNKTSATSPSERQLQYMAFQRAGGKMVLFGGESDWPSNETWSYDSTNNTWTDMQPKDSPWARWWHSMAYDPIKCEVVMVGGEYDNGFNWNDESWTYNLTTNTWTEGSLNAPSGRFAHCAAYDSDNGKIVMFGGEQAGGSFGYGDTWTYDLSTNFWTLMSPLNDQLVEPRGGYYPVMAYDSHAKVMVCFGRVPGCGVQTYNETWTYDLSANQWTLKNTMDAPPSRMGGAMIYDSRIGEMILFGGGNPLTGLPWNDTWSYNVSTNIWTNRTPNESPGPRNGHQMVYLDSTGEILLFGGNGKIEPTNDTWVYNSSLNKWTIINTKNAPLPRYSYAMAYDSLRNEVILIGGYVIGFHESLNDTWCFNLTTYNWTKINTVYAPPGIGGHTLVYNTRLNEMVLFGGHVRGFFADSYYPNGETWVFHHFSYYKNGTYTPQSIDTSGPTDYNIIEWTADIPNGTALSFQLRSASTNESLQNAEFVGPDGTNKTYYNASGQQINATHNGSRWIQYKAFLSTIYDSYTPILKSVKIQYDRLPDKAVLNAPSDMEWTNNTRPIFNWTFLDDDSLPKGFEWEMDNSQAFDSLDYDSGQILSANQTYRPDKPLADGTWYWRVKTLDSDGSWGPFSDPKVLNIDTGPPKSFQPLADPPGWTNQAIQLSFDTTDSGAGIGHYEISIDGVDQGSQSSPFTLPMLSDGTHNIEVTAFDKLWNNLTSTVKVYQDTTPPLPFTLTAQPSNWTSLSPTISFNTSDEPSGMDHFELGIDEGPFTAQSSPVSLSNLTDGQRNITVKAYDIAGNYRDGRVVVFIDKSSPVNFSITSDSLSWTKENQNISFTALDGLSEIDHYEVKLPGRNFTLQNSPYRIPDLSDGRYNITIRAYDKALNFAEAVFEVLIDKTPPVNFTPTANPPSWTNQNPNITYSTIDITSGVSGYGVKVDSGNLTMHPSPFLIANLSDGQHQVVVRAYDAAGNYVEGTTTVYFDKTPPAQLSLKINNGAKSSGKRSVTLSIDASDATSGLDSVCFSNNGTSYSSWESFTTSKIWDLSKGQGSKTIYLKVKDKAGNEAIPITAAIQYAPPAAGVISVLIPFLAVLMLVIVVAAIGGLAWRKSRKGKAEAESPAPSGEELEGAPPTAVEEEAPPAEPETEPEPPTATVLTEAPAIPAKAASAPVVPVQTVKAPAPPPTSVPGPKIPAHPISAPQIVKLPIPAVTAPEGFAVEDIFLMYRDGRLIQHTTRRLKADMDVDIMTSMLKAVQEFVKESIGMETGAELGSMEYGENKILFEKGLHTILASVITGKEPEGFRDEMRGAVKNIESEFAPVLPTWDGTTNKLAGAKRFLAQLGTFAPAAVTPAVKPSGEVSLKAELEFYQGFVRLKVAVKNSMPTAILSAEFKLVYNRDALRLDTIEPENLKRGEEAVLGVVEAGEKKTVAFYLDPQICTESYVEGVLSFKDAHGKLLTLTMPRKMASVVCPILYTDENINTAMLKRMAVDELGQKDTKVFSIPGAITPQKAFEVAKAAVQHHDVRQVRELVEKDPFIGEAWYYGKAKGREDRIVIRTRALADKNLLEFFVASTSTLMLTGMLAELKTDLNKELDSRNVRTGMRQVTSQKEVDALGAITTLLEKASGTELDAGDTFAGR